MAATHPPEVAVMSRSVAAIVVCCALVSGAGAVLPAHAQLQGVQSKEAQPERGPADGVEARIEALVGAVVRVRARALDDARSNATLGQSREGSGVVIDDAGHVLTIGYLVIEPDSIQLTTATGRTVPATLAGYDHATGFGLLRAQAPLDVRPLALGDAAALKEGDAVMVLPFGGRDAASMAQVVSTRRFAGSWEYLVDRALFTSPPTPAWAGAALVSRDIRLVGIGSLLVQNAAAPTELLPGNMFVPIDLVKPIIADLKAQGRAAGPPRPWIGLATEEVEGRLLVTRVSPESPADLAGIRRGEVVIGIAGENVQTHAELYRRLWTLGPAGTVVPLRVQSATGAREVEVRSIDRAAYFKEKKPL
jgi:S1-C subfamily serine protease